MARSRRMLIFLALVAPLMILALALATVSVAAPNAIIIGQVLLQGRMDHSGTTIFYNGAAYTFTNPEGEFALAVTTGAPATIRAKHTGYLSRQYTVSDPRGLLTVPATTLLLGDADDDDDIDLNDLLIVVQAFRTSPPSDPRADLDGDGQVTEADLLPVVTNYGRTGPLPWTDETATPTPTLAPTGTITPTATITATVTVTPTMIITPTMTVTATATLAPTDTVVPPSPTAITTTPAPATPTVVATTTPVAPVTPTDTPPPTIAPLPTDTPAPLPTDTPPATAIPTDLPPPTPTATPLPG